MPDIQGKFELLVQNGYRHWSKQLVEKRLIEDPLVRQYVVHDDKYHFNPNTIAIYNFADNPMFGKYKTVVLDKQDGIVISVKSSKSVLHKYTKHVLISGLSLQKSIARILGLASFHSISLVHLVFFSLHAYSKRNTDWVGLHFSEDFDMQKNPITFKSIKNHYTLSFDNTNPCIHKRISDSLQHNDILSRITHRYHESISWSCPRSSHKTGSMIFNTDFYNPTDTLIRFDFKHVIDEIIHDWHYIYICHVAREHDLWFLRDEHGYFYGRAMRNRQNY